LFNVHAETFERFRSGRGQVVSIIQPPEFLESIVQRNSQMPGEMVVTDSRRTQARGRVRNKLPARLVHEYAQTLEHPGNLRPLATVESVLPLRVHFNQSLCF